jgi:hypothetical protein
VEERERRLNELWKTYQRKKSELDLEYRKAREQLEQDYGDLPPALVDQSSHISDADTLII